MSGENFAGGWISVSRGLFDYFNTIMGTIEGVRAFTVDSFPRTMPDDAPDYFIWMIKVGGGQEVVQRNSRTQVINGAYKMNAEFTAFCTDEVTGKRVAGAVIDALPVGQGDNIDGLMRLYQVTQPDGDWTTMNVLNDERAGDAQRFWKLTIQMECAFSNALTVL